jgi:hypothetical protein
MAAVIQLNAAFVRLGFSDDAADVLTDPDMENIQIDSLKYFDDKGVKILCATLRKPGGTIDEPGQGRGAVARAIPNPGVYVSTRAEMNLKSACFLAMHYERTSRTLRTADLTVERVHRFAQYKEAEEDYKKADEVLKLDKPEKIMDFIDDWPEHLALYNGQNARPLDYVIRNDVIVPAEATDPSFGEVGSVYASLRDEITARADHQAPQYRVDNAKVFELLNEAVTEHKHVKTWIKPFATLRNGRAAWFAFKAHYRGSSELEAIETTAENRLDTLVYRGEKPRYNFETHVSMHRKSHLELEKATGQLIPGPTKVRRLLKSLQASTMAIPVGTIRAIEDLRTDFDASVNYLRAFISSSNESEVRNVAGFDRAKAGKNNRGNKRNDDKKRSGGSSQGESKALDRYYKPDEWWKLDQKTREKILQIRKKRNISETTTSKSKHRKESVPSDSEDSSKEKLPTTQRGKKKAKVSK